MEKPLQQCEAEKPKALLEEHVGMLIKFNDCLTFASEEEFGKNLNLLLESLSAKDKKRT